MAKLKLKKKFKIVKKVNNEKEIDIFKLGSLLQFETKSWQAGKKISDKSKLKLSEDEANWINANKRLIDKKHLRGINKIIAHARSTVTFYSLPFPINGIHFIPSEKIEEVMNRLMEIQMQLDDQVSLFVAEYEDYIKEAEQNLGGNLFNIYDYPSKEELKNRFKINFRFFEFVTPSNLSEEVKEEETRKYKEMIAEARQNSIMALKQGFKEIIDNLVTKLSEKLEGEDKRIQTRSLEKINEFFEIFKYKNIFKDEELEAQIIEAKKIIDGVDSGALKDDNALMEKIGEGLSIVNDELTKQIKFISNNKRKLRL